MSHEKIEKNVGLMGVLIAVAISFGGLAEIVPLMYSAEQVEPLPGMKPRPALEQAGFDIFENNLGRSRWPAPAPGASASASRAASSTAPAAS